MNKNLTVCFALFFVFVILFASGCTGNSGSSSNSVQSAKNTVIPTPTPIPGPEEIFHSYFSAYEYLDEDRIWELLSEKAKTGSTKNGIYNTIYSLYSQSSGPTDYEITNAEIGESAATLYIDVDALVKGYKITHKKEVPFVRENGVWKIDEFVVLL